MPRIEAHPWTRFAALGDSITEGYGMDPVPGVEQLPWVERVERDLAATQPGFELHNLGRRNLRAAQIRETQLKPALALRPDLVSIAAGPNDLIAEELDGGQLERDMEPMHAAFAEAGAFVFTFSYMNMPASGLLPDEGARWLRERMVVLHEAIRTLADRYDALYIDLFNDPASSNPGFFSADLKHANAAGQAFVAERTLRALSAAQPVEAPAQPKAAR